MIVPRTVVVIVLVLCVISYSDAGKSKGLVLRQRETNAINFLR